MAPRLLFKKIPDTGGSRSCECNRFYYELIPRFDFSEMKVIGYCLTLYSKAALKKHSAPYLRDFRFASVQSAEDYVNSLQNEALTTFPIYDPYEPYEHDDEVDDDW